MNANEFRTVLRGNNGASGAGLLVEPQIAGGNNKYRGLFEGFRDDGSYNAAYGVPKYSMKIFTSFGFFIEGHFEEAGLSSADPNIIVDGSCTEFGFGPNITVDQELRIIDSDRYAINSGRYSRVRRVWNGSGAPNPTDASKYYISPSAGIGTLI